MARVVVGIGMLLVAVVAIAGPALAHGGGGGGGAGGRGDLEERIDALRAKAAALREQGSREDAEHVAKMAELLDRVRAIRRQSNELERRGKDLRASGHEDDAQRAMEESGRLWKASEEILRKVEGGAERSHDDAVREKVRELEKRVVVLRDDGRPLEAEEAERLLSLLRAAHAGAEKGEPWSGEHATVELRRAKEKKDHDVRHHRELHLDVERAQRVRKAAALLREAGLADLAAHVEREAGTLYRSVDLGSTKDGDFRELTSFAGRKNERKDVFVFTEPLRPVPPRPPTPPVAVVPPPPPAVAPPLAPGQRRGHDEVAQLRKEMHELRRQMEELRAVLRELRSTR
jgi:hypothetical protein